MCAPSLCAPLLALRTGRGPMSGTKSGRKQGRAHFVLSSATRTRETTNEILGRETRTRYALDS